MSGTAESSQKPMLTLEELAVRLNISQSQAKRLLLKRGVNWEFEYRCGYYGRYSVGLVSSRIVGPIKRTKDYKSILERNEKERDPATIAKRTAAKDKREAKRVKEQQRLKELREINRIRIEAMIDSLTGDDLLTSGIFSLIALNRIARSLTNRSDVYAKKNKLVRWLHENGYCQSTELHEQHFPGKICFDCDGEGDCNDDPCNRCDGSGWYREPRTVQLFLFRFSILGIEFSFHQPVELVDWLSVSDFEVTEKINGDVEHAPDLISAFGCSADYAMRVVNRLVEFIDNKPE